ncbi:hypothetical protein KIW84_020520 [Lathyrus oleraceus]|uniref:Uncharacterized protein n=1 Tax=Pisum sativum TaxID=3888 RepID=A0A9D4Y5A3_PEA|nr:hypothetical protein KIW84_020520 [Pisum sativum]
MIISESSNNMQLRDGNASSVGNVMNNLAQVMAASIVGLIGENSVMADQQKNDYLRSSYRCKDRVYQYLANDRDNSKGSNGKVSIAQSERSPVLLLMAGDESSCKVQKSKDGHGTAGVTKAAAGISNHATPKAKQSRTQTNVGNRNVQENGVDPSGLDTRVHSRKSSRKKQHVSYIGTAGNGEFENASKKPQKDKPVKTTKEKKREVPPNGRLFNETGPTSFTADVDGENGETRNKTNGQPGKICCYC